MTTTSSPQELGRAVKNGDYPIRVTGKELVSCIDKICSLSRIVFYSVCASVAAVALVCVGPQLGVLLATGLGGPLAVAAAAAGGGIAFTVLGLDTTVAAVKIANGGGGVKILSKIRSRNWNQVSDTEGILS